MKSLINNALETEQHSLEYFNGLAEKCHYNEGVKNILRMLAKEQKIQIDILNQWNVKIHPDYVSSAFFEDSKLILQDLKAKIDSFSCEIDHLNLYRHAKEIQEKSLQSYVDAKEELSNAEYLGLLSTLITQKRKQIILLDNIIELLLRPEQWIESPEFNRLEEY